MNTSAENGNAMEQGSGVTEVKTRLVALEREFTAIENRVLYLENSTSQKEKRLSTLEQFHQNNLIGEARKDEQFKNMNDRFSRVEENISRINGTLSKIMWLVISGIIAALLSFLLKGGAFI